jgi:hypothetical protein
MHYDNEIENLVLGHLRNKASVQVHNYLSRGRAYAAKDVGFLKEQWVSLIREMFNFDPTNRQEMDDIESEILLRNEEIPYHLVEAELDVFGKKIADEIERIRIEDPTRYQRAAESISEEVEAFHEQLKKPSS